LDQHPIPKREKNCVDPEIIPPNRVYRCSARASGVWTSLDAGRGQRNYFAKSGPLAVILIALLLGILGAAMLVILLGAFLLFISLAVVLVTVFIFFGLIRRQIRRLL
jgi:hypothetical protein